MKKSVLLNCCVALLLGSPIIKAQTPCELLTTVSPNTPICAGTHVTLEVATKGINLGTGVDGDLSINFPDEIETKKPLRVKGKGFYPNGSDLYLKFNFKYQKSK